MVNSINNLESKRTQLIKESTNLNNQECCEEIKRLISQRNNLLELKKNVMYRIKQYKLEIKHLNNDIKKEEKKIKESEQLLDDIKVIEEKIEFCSKEIEFVSEICSSLNNDMINKLQYCTDNNFKNIQSDNFNKVILNYNYELFIKNKFGKMNVNELSYNEKLVLAISFIFALHNLNAFNIPIFMDNFLGNLDVNKKMNIARCLQKVEDTQIILLMSDEEYNGRFKEIISDYVGKKYSLELDNSKDIKEFKAVLYE